MVDQIQAIARMNAMLPAEMMRETNVPGLSNEERRARGSAVTQQYQDALTQFVGADTAKELMARTLVSLPRGLSSGAVGLSTVRLPGGHLVGRRLRTIRASVTATVVAAVPSGD